MDDHTPADRPTTHPRELGETAVTAFFNHFARDRDVVASTQNLALAALRTGCTGGRGRVSSTP
jgi:hypothetical protein